MTPPTPDAIWSLATQYLGQHVHVHDSLDSTNTNALALANDRSAAGLVILAREQSAGRGQYGRSWHATRDSSVLMSVLLFPPPELRRPAMLTAWAAVSVCETIRKLTNLQASIKWPNDVLMLGKKLCGILIEQRTTGHADFPLASVVGIGLNVTQSTEMFERAGLPLAGSLASMSGRAFEFTEVARALINQLDEQYAPLQSGDFRTLESLWKRRLGLHGKSVIVEGIHERYRGRLLEVTLASVELETDTGEVVRLLPETIRHVESAES